MITFRKYIRIGNRPDIPAVTGPEPSEVCEVPTELTVTEHIYMKGTSESISGSVDGCVPAVYSLNDVPYDDIQIQVDGVTGPNNVYFMDDGGTLGSWLLLSNETLDTGRLSADLDSNTAEIVVQALQSTDSAEFEITFTSLPELCANPGPDLSPDYSPDMSEETVNYAHSVDGCSAVTYALSNIDDDKLQVQITSTTDDIQVFVYGDSGLIDSAEVSSTYDTGVLTGEFSSGEATVVITGADESASSDYGLTLFAELAETYYLNVSESSPYVWYKLNESSGSTAVDSSGNGFDGAISGSPVYDTNVFPAGVDEDFDTSILSQGGDKPSLYMLVSFDASIPSSMLNDAFSYEIFFRDLEAETNNGTHTLMIGWSNASFGEKNIALRVRQGKISLLHRDSGGTNHNEFGSTDILEDEWYRARVVHDPDTKNLKVLLASSADWNDWSVEIDATYDSLIAGDGTPVRLLRGYSSGNHFWGYAANSIYWDRAISYAEVPVP